MTFTHELQIWTPFYKSFDLLISDKNLTEYNCNVKPDLSKFNNWFKLITDYPIKTFIQLVPWCLACQADHKHALKKSPTSF